MAPPDLRPIELAARLLGAPIDALDPVGGGRNSRVYHVRSARGEFALKQYPARDQDPRDRLGAEWRALELMARHGIDRVPRALAADTERGFILLSWLDGAAPGPIGAADIAQAAGFLARIHALRGDPAAAAFGPASEACLSGHEIQRQVGQRLDRLRDVAAAEDRLHRFLDGPFAALSEHLFAQARARLGEGFDAALPADRRSLVPSDFGFHNSLRRADGSLVFFDFEYFGWDDPVKLTADIMLHPGTALSPVLVQQFRRAAETLYGGDPGFGTRLAAFLPLFGLRWVLILLNEFLPDRWQRRVAAGAVEDWETAKQRQLARAGALLAQLEETQGGS
jgi:Phosphotransferase enzyme family